MALARKGTRRITVEGATYRWVVAPNDGYIVLVNDADRLVPLDHSPADSSSG
jgi:hypothetical protein